MDNFQIETAQNVSISQNIANLGVRALAFVIDVFIILLYELLMIIVFKGADLPQFSFFIGLMIFGLPPFLYHLLFETFNNGQSLGKAALRIRVVKTDGTRPAFSNYLVRWLLRFIDFSITSGGCALVSFLLNGKGQRLGDIAANTTVITEQNRHHLQDTLAVEIPADYKPVYPQVSVFSDHDMQTVKDLFQNARRRQNTKVLVSLSEKLAGEMEILPPPDPISFIKQVITDYNYYTQQ